MCGKMWIFRRGRRIGTYILKGWEGQKWSIKWQGQPSSEPYILFINGWERISWRQENNTIAFWNFAISLLLLVHHFAISPFHYMNWFTTSPFHHSVHLLFHHFNISVCWSYTILLIKFSRHLTHHLYQYYILTDHLSNYSESYESGVDRFSPN